MKRLVVFAVSVILIVSCLAGSITTKADTSATTKQWQFETGIRGFNTEPSTPSAGNKMFYYLHVLIFKRKLHEELTACAARHSASATARGRVTECYHPLYDRLSAVGIHTQRRDSLGA